jgi:two-component system nitrate/nitrite response regulator NarL
MTARIRLLLLDDHALFRESLSQLLDTEPDFRMVVHCATCEEALEALSREVIDLVLLDYDLGEETGLQFIRRAREGYKGRVFIVTAGMTDSDSVRALGQGVCGIFLKHSAPALLSEAIRKVMAGETWIDQRCIRALVQAVEKSGEQERPKQLSGREREVLKGVFEGLTNKEIAQQLDISEASVKSALQQLFMKTSVRTRSQLVRVALEEYGTAWGLRP